MPCLVFLSATAVKLKKPFSPFADDPTLLAQVENLSIAYFQTPYKFMQTLESSFLLKAIPGIDMQLFQGNTLSVEESFIKLVIDGAKHASLSTAETKSLIKFVIGLRSLFGQSEESEYSFPHLWNIVSESQAVKEKYVRLLKQRIHSLIAEHNDALSACGIAPMYLLMRHYLGMWADALESTDNDRIQELSKHLSLIQTMSNVISSLPGAPHITMNSDLSRDMKTQLFAIVAIVKDVRNTKSLEQLQELQAMLGALDYNVWGNANHYKTNFQLLNAALYVFFQAKSNDPSEFVSSPAFSQIRKRLLKISYKSTQSNYLPTQTQLEKKLPIDFSETTKFTKESIMEIASKLIPGSTDLNNIGASELLKLLRTSIVRTSSTSINESDFSTLETYINAIHDFFGKVDKEYSTLFELVSHYNDNAAMLQLIADKTVKEWKAIDYELTKEFKKTAAYPFYILMHAYMTALVDLLSDTQAEDFNDQYAFLKEHFSLLEAFVHVVNKKNSGEKHITLTKDVDPLSIGSNQELNSLFKFLEDKPLKLPGMNPVLNASVIKEMIPALREKIDAFVVTFGSQWKGTALMRRHIPAVLFGLHYLELIDDEKELIGNVYGKTGIKSMYTHLKYLFHRISPERKRRVTKNKR